jgi:hypothetical protein
MVDNAVSSGAMPRNGTLPAAEKTTLLNWLQQGAPCAGPKPTDSGANCPVGLGGAPTL